MYELAIMIVNEAQVSDTLSAGEIAHKFKRRYHTARSPLYISTHVPQKNV
jgi:hypothetical protein